jgi:hypothetical protein
VKRVAEIKPLMTQAYRNGRGGCGSPRGIEINLNVAQLAVEQERAGHALVGALMSRNLGKP